MRQQHVAGDKVFVDYSGKKLAIIDPLTGEIREAEIFVAVLGAPNLTYAEAIGTWTLEIIKRSDTAKGFELLPRRWVVERTIAWLNRNRRLAKDFEKTVESAVAWIMIASIKLLSRRMARA